MSKTNSNFIAILSIIAMLFFNSCSDDDKVSTGFYTMLATVNPINDTEYYLVLDNGETLYPSTMAGYTPKENQRVYVDFTLLPNTNTDYNYYARINLIRNITTKNVAEINNSADLTQMGNDPVSLKSLWFGDDYLNLRFIIKMDTKSHLINLVRNNMADYPSDGKVHLELRHNAYDDPAYQEGSGMAAFNIRPYVKDLKVNETMDFVIHVNDWDDSSKTYNITYKKHDVNTSGTGSLSDFTSTTYNSDLEFGITF